MCDWTRGSPRNETVVRPISSRAWMGFQGLERFADLAKAVTARGALQNSRLRAYNSRCRTDAANRISQHVGVNRFDVSNLSSWSGEIMNMKRCLMVFVIVLTATSGWSNAGPGSLGSVKPPPGPRSRILPFPPMQGPIVVDGPIRQGGVI
jgi:hypothetical protein